MISRVERRESSPTAAVLGRLCGGLGITLSSLFASVEPAASPLARASRQGCFAGFLHNHYVGMLVFAGIALSYVLQG